MYSVFLDYLFFQISRLFSVERATEGALPVEEDLPWADPDAAPECAHEVAHHLPEEDIRR